MVMPASYDALVEGFSRKLAEARGNIESKVMTLKETAAEIAATTEGVFIEPVPIIEPTGPELDIIAVTVLQPKRRGRPPGSRNRPKEHK